MALISSSVGNRNSGLITHQFESMPKLKVKECRPFFCIIITRSLEISALLQPFSDATFRMRWERSLDIIHFYSSWRIFALPKESVYEDLNNYVKLF
jgi:hypothetical protein